MRKVTDEQMKEIQLRILTQIDEICKGENFRYSFFNIKFFM